MRKWIWKRRVRWMASEHVRDAKQATQMWLRQQQQQQTYTQLNPQETPARYTFEHHHHYLYYYTTEQL